MKTLTPVLFAFALALTAVPGSAAGHSYGGWGMHGGMHWGGPGSGMMDPDKLSDEYLDRLGEAMAERFQSMQQIASEKDPAARRELLREHFDSMYQQRGKDRGAGKQGQGQNRGSMMGQGMMGPGMMGYGMGPGMMGPGMQLSDEYLDEIGEHMAEQHARMQRIAETEDKSERRELLREHFEEMREFMKSMHGY